MGRRPFLTTSPSRPTSPHSLTMSIDKSAVVTFPLQLAQHLNVFGTRVMPVMLSSDVFVFQPVSTAGPAANTSVPLVCGS